MAWLTYDKFRSSFSAAKNASEGALDLSYGAAEDELVELVGQAIVDDAKAGAPSDPVGSAKVIRAHSFLSFATFLINNRTVKKEQSTESAGIGSNNVNNEYYSGKELIDLSNEWRDKAMRAINGFLDSPVKEEVCETEGTESVPIQIVW